MSYFSDIKKSFKPKHYINYGAILLVLVIFTLLNYTVGISRSMTSLLPQIAYSIILAVSLNLVVGLLGELSLGHAGFMCVGAYLGTFLSNSILSAVPTMPLPIVLILSMLLGGTSAAVFGFVVGLPALRLRGDYLAIVTLAFGEIVRTIFKNLPAEHFGGAQGLTSIYNKTALDAAKRGAMPLFIPAFIVVLIMLAVIQNVFRSKHGRAITAIRDNEIAAKAMGINVTYYKLFAFVLAAFFAGIAGVIYGSSVSPVEYSFFSYNYSIEILVMVVLGGMGSINGSIIAATVITYVNHLLTANFSGDTMSAVKNLIYALILILMVIYKNAPALKKYRERFSLANLLAKFKKRDASVVDDDSAEWERVPTKIMTDEILSTDLTLSNFDADKPDKGGCE